MELLGIIAEYDPFHAYHAYHIRKSRELTAADGVVCVMSGDFVQRGGYALLDKFARAEAAVKCGADLVLELPLPWCMAGAESFARGGIGLLNSLSCIDSVSFGSECGDAQLLQELAAALLSPAFEERIRERLNRGLPFAQARQEAVGEIAGVEKASLLSRPNNILGVEYCKALLLQNSSIRPVTVKRTVSEHNGEGSASALRACYAGGEDIAALLPDGSAEVFRRERENGNIPDRRMLDIAILSRLRMLSGADFSSIPDCSEGLENRLRRVSRTGTSPDAIVNEVSGRRYPKARVRRMLYAAALGIKKEDSEGLPPYIRPLCANERGKEILHSIKKNSSVPLVSRGGDVRGLGSRGERVFELGSAAHDVYVLGRKDENSRLSDEDYQKSLRFF